MFTHSLLVPGTRFNTGKGIAVVTKIEGKNCYANYEDGTPVNTASYKGREISAGFFRANGIVRAINSGEFELLSPDSSYFRSIAYSENFKVA